ncbi:glycosyltransferase, partial [Patescibacteria group bacterium]|nr:glycosyltransferase [Patescibacteria group bacterium]
MKTAVLPHALDHIGGAEILALTLARGLGADVYTTNVDPERIAACGFTDVLPRIRSIGRLPARAPFRQQLALWRFRRLNLAGRYDRVVIASDWAIGAAVRNHPNLWYVHGPLNELWEFRDQVRAETLAGWMRPLFDIWTHFNRFIVKRYARRVDRWVCNSENVQGRIARIFGTTAPVVHPPIPTAAYRYAPPRGYWLSVNRLVGHKRIEVQLEAFRQMPERRLVIVGSYEEGTRQFEEYKKRLEELAPPNVSFRHWVPDAELRRLYADCIGFIATSEREDFGMAAVEAMASGKPVVAPGDGGYRESVIDGKTGLLLPKMDAAHLTSAVAAVEAKLRPNPLCYQAACQKRAADF